MIPFVLLPFSFPPPTTCSDGGVLIFPQPPLVDFSKNPYYDGKFKFYDQTLLDEVKNNNKDCHEMMRLLAVCHTVMVDNTGGEYPIPPPIST